MLKNITIKQILSNDEYSKNKRELKIDLIKTVLVLGMILSHTLDFFITRNSFIGGLSSYLNLVSFSGFLFVFGYNAYNAYIKKEKSDVIEKKIAKNILILIIYYFISGFLYEYLIRKNRVFFDYIKILFFLKLPCYSEFLLTFAILNVIILIFRKQLKKISENKIYMFICIAISIIFVLVEPIKKEIPYIYLLFKTNVMSFPILPYINLFFFGIYFAKYKPKFDREICIVLYGLLCFHIIMNSEGFATRFPVNIAYISGSYAFIYIYYYIFNYIESKLNNKKWMGYISFIRKK